MKPDYAADHVLNDLIQRALREDIEDGDHTSLALVPNGFVQNAQIISKDKGVLAGVEMALKVFHMQDSNLELEVRKQDGQLINPGDPILKVRGSGRSILTAERLVLNFMQRMSGIASQVHRLNSLIAHTKARLLDTRKTTPNFRVLEKWAVQIGGGQNHRFGLFDMILIKDNHIEYAGGVSSALDRAQAYLRENRLKLKIEIETTDMNQIHEALNHGGADIVMLDNMNTSMMTEAVALINGQVKVEASGNITEQRICEVAETGVDYISMGALTHSYKSIDLSLKAIS